MVEFARGCAINGSYYFSGRVGPDVQFDIEGLSISQSISNVKEASFKRKMNTKDPNDIEMSTVQEVFILTEHRKAKPETSSNSKVIDLLPLNKGKGDYYVIAVRSDD